jgi:peptidoglycan/LPS O-acetylase OafA/YrhL
MLLSEYTTNRDNNFNLIRFIAAFTVLYTHSFSLLSGDMNDEPMRVFLGMSLGDISVDIFFITSGFLITSSYINRGNLIAFAWARILRIYPALIVAVTLSVFVLGVWFTNLNILEYLSHPDTYKYFFKNIMLLFGIDFFLPGVFQDIPWKGAVNGSLWTLTYEIRMYIILAFILTFIVCLNKKVPKITFKNILLFLGILSVLVLIYNHFIPLREGSVFVSKFIRLFSAFFIGAMFFVWKDNIVLSYKWFMILLVLLILSSVDKDLYFVMYSLTLAYLIFFIAYVPKGNILKFNKFGDYSYGLYIYAFPIQQILIALNPNISILMLIIMSFLLTLISAVLSWNLIEKRFLKKKNNYKFIEKILKKLKLESKCIGIN